MFSRSDHHHDCQQSTSPPPTLGTRRQRSPDPAPLEAEGEDALTRTSPQSKRIIKRGRTTSPPKEGPIPSPPSLANPFPLNERPTAESEDSTQPPASLLVAEQTAHLESLLDSVLATLVIIQAAATTPIALSNHTREALSVLNKIAHTSAGNHALPTSPPVPGRQPKKSYANAATPCPTTKKVVSTARSSPAGQPTRQRTHANHSPPPRHPHSPNRLIVRWAGHPVPQPSTSLSNLVENLNDELIGVCRFNQKRYVEAVNVTKSGNLVIYTTTPAVAADLKAKPNVVQRCVRFGIPDFSLPDVLPELDLDVPWHGVVIHDVHAAALRDAFDSTEEKSDVWNALEEGGVVTKDIRGNLKVLCRDGEEFEKERLSMLVRFEDPHICTRLQRDGIFLLGSWCRVSRYRGPKNRRTSLASPRPTSQVS